MIRRPPRSTRTDHTLSLHDALPISLLNDRVIGKVEQPLVRLRPFAGRQRRGRAIGAIDVQPDTMGLADVGDVGNRIDRSEEHTSELQSLMRISYAVFCLKKKKK